MSFKSSCLISNHRRPATIRIKKRLFARLCPPSNSNIFKIEPEFEFDELFPIRPKFQLSSIKCNREVLSVVL